MKCINCGKESNLISKFLGVCLTCIRNDFKKVKPIIEEAQRKSREKFNLPTHQILVQGEPAKPPKEGGKCLQTVRCKICVNECIVSEGERGYCGLRKNVSGKLVHLAGTAEKGLLDWYYDPLPTNCVAGWVCEGNKQYGKNNLAVFYRACTFNCLFCQNWHFRQTRIYANKNHELTRMMSAEELANYVDEKTYCVCYFGGDPTPQLPHALATSRRVLERVRICWETNGSMNQNLLEQMAKLSFASGGCIKFDLKTYDEKLSLALCGVSNKRTLENFVYLTNWIKGRKVSQPFLIASTLLVPGYIDTEEVYQIAKFIAQLNPEISYSLLAFYPQFFMSDLPVTSRKQAEECLSVAKKVGLKNAHLGNIHLLR